MPQAHQASKENYWNDGKERTREICICATCIYLSVPYTDSVLLNTPPSSSRGNAEILISAEKTFNRLEYVRRRYRGKMRESNNVLASKARCAWKTHFYFGMQAVNVSRESFIHWKNVKCRKNIYVWLCDARQNEQQHQYRSGILHLVPLYFNLLHLFSSLFAMNFAFCLHTAFFHTDIENASSSRLEMFQMCEYQQSA